MKRIAIISILLFFAATSRAVLIEQTPIRKTKGASTYTIAASNTPAHLKSTADYICDGTDDQVQINAAVQALPDMALINGNKVGGGTISCLPGHFAINGTITIDRAITFEGQGSAQTMFRLADSADCTMFQFTENGTTTTYALSHIRKLKIEGNKDNQGAGTFYAIEQVGGAVDIGVSDVWINDWKGIGVKMRRYWDHCFHRCQFEGISGYAISFELPTDVSGAGASLTDTDATVDLSADTPDLSGVTANDALLRIADATDGLYGSQEFTITAVNDGADTVEVSPTPASTRASKSWAISESSRQPRVTWIQKSYYLSEGTSGAGFVEFVGDFASEYIVISENYIGGGGHGLTAAIKIDAPVRYATIRNNTFRMWAWDIYVVGGAGDNLKDSTIADNYSFSTTTPFFYNHSSNGCLSMRVDIVENRIVRGAALAADIEGLIYCVTGEDLFIAGNKFTLTDQSTDEYDRIIKVHTADSIRPIVINNIAEGIGGTEGDFVYTASAITPIVHNNIGGDDPTTLVRVGASGATAHTYGKAIIESDSHVALQFLTPNTAIAYIMFGDPEDDNHGQISYAHSSGALTLTAGASSALVMTGLDMKLPGYNEAAAGKYRKIYADEDGNIVVGDADVDNND